ncbi:MAG: energy transducer TonB [Verrucomicrobiota bacterium]
MKVLTILFFIGVLLLGNACAAPGNAVTPPQLLKRGPITYPLLAKMAKQQGVTHLQLTIGKSGKIRNIKLAKSSGSILLDSAAVDSASTWTFKPARRRDGTAVMTTITCPIRFELVAVP